VLVNLLSNAIDAMRAVPPPRRLTVETGRRDDHVAVTVADTGPGIAPGLEGRIFLPFVTTKGTEGTGLGLYISRQIARDAGGDLTLEPADGHGARFVLRLPAAPAPAGEPPPVQAPADARSDAAPLGGLRILLVDDEAVVRRPVARYLARRGARVTEAADGYEALACLERAEVDVVLTDLRMPVMDGPELYRRLSTERPALARHGVFFYGDLRPLDGGEAPVPAERVLLKPVDLREVERKVLEVAGRRDA
jgi:CheY-like chemotaxis protein